MKKTNKILAIALVAIMILAALFVPVKSLATDDLKTITINTVEAGKTIKAIEMFKITERVGDEIYYDFANDTVKAFFASKGQSTLFDAMDFMNKKNATELQALADEFYTYISTNVSSLIKAATVSETTATIAEVEDGYYVIYDMAPGTNTPKSAAVLRNVTDAAITLKTNAITLDKKASVNDASATKADNVSAQVGDTVYFEVTTQVPNVDGYAENQLVFTFTDTLADTLKYNNDLKVKINGNEVSAITDSNNSENVIELAMGEHLRTNTKTFKDATKTYTAGDSIVITYSAKVKTGAAVESVVTNNTVNLTLSQTATRADETQTKVLNDVVNIYTYIVDVTKVNSNLEGLANTEFQVLDSTGAAITFIENAQGDYVKYDGLATGTQVTTLKTTAEVRTTDSDTGAETITTPAGKLRIAGLAVGNYTLKETKATTGYSVPKDSAFEFTIAATDFTTATFAFDNNANGFVSTQAVAVDGKTFTGINVKNAQKGSLPETGGVGTVIFTAVGIALMAGACTLIVVRNRTSKEN